jgi:hypothetical protein
VVTAHFSFLLSQHRVRHLAILE